MASIDKDAKVVAELEAELRTKLDAVENDLKRETRIAAALGFAGFGAFLGAFLLPVLWPFVVVFYTQYLESAFNRWWVNLLTLPVIALVGLGLFHFKKKTRKWYGILEVMLGLVAGWLAISKVATAGLAEGITLVGAVYFVVRGIDNIYTSIDELKADRERVILRENPMLGYPKTFDDLKRALNTPTGAELTRRRYE